MKSILILLCLLPGIVLAQEQTFLDSWTRGDKAADVNGDTVVNTVDLTAYIASLDSTDPDDPVDPVDPDDPDPEPELGYGDGWPNPHGKNVITPEDISWESGTWSVKPDDLPGRVAEKFGATITDDPLYLTFKGFVIDADGGNYGFRARSLPDGSRIDFVDCVVLNARQGMEFSGGTDDDRSFHVRLFECDIYDTHIGRGNTSVEVAAFISPSKNSRGSTFGAYGCIVINAGFDGSSGSRQDTVQWFDHAFYFNHNGAHEEFLDNIIIGFAAQGIKGPWAGMTIRRNVFLDGAFAGFSGADGSEQLTTGRRDTVGSITDNLIMYMTDIPRQRAAHSMGWDFKSCDMEFSRNIIANPRPLIDNGYDRPVLWITNQMDNPVRITGSDNHAYGYNKLFNFRKGSAGGGDVPAEDLLTWESDIKLHDEELPELDLERLKAELRSGDLPREQARAEIYRRLGLID